MAVKTPINECVIPQVLCVIYEYTSIGRDSYSVHYDWSAQSNCLVTIVPSRSIRVLFTQSFIFMSLILFVYLWIFFNILFTYLCVLRSFIYLVYSFSIIFVHLKNNLFSTVLFRSFVLTFNFKDKYIVLCYSVVMELKHPIISIKYQLQR